MHGLKSLQFMTGIPFFVHGNLVQPWFKFDMFLEPVREKCVGSGMLYIHYLKAYSAHAVKPAPGNSYVPNV